MNDGKAEEWTPTNEEIARRAYALFEARGGSPGGTWDDWLAAEQQLRAERKASPDRPPTSERTPPNPPKPRPARPKTVAAGPKAGKPRRSS